MHTDHRFVGELRLALLLRFAPLLFVLVYLLLQILALALAYGNKTEADFTALALRLLFLTGLLVARGDCAHKELPAHFVREGKGGRQADAHSLLSIFKLVFPSLSERKSFERLLLKVVRVEAFARVDDLCHNVASASVQGSVELTLLKRHKRNLDHNSALSWRELQSVIKNVEKNRLINLKVRAHIRCQFLSIVRESIQIELQFNTR